MRAFGKMSLWLAVVFCALWSERSAFAKLAEYQYPNEIKTALDYDNWNRLKLVRSTDRHNQQLGRFEYTLLNRDNRSKLTEDLKGRTRIVDYTYDSLDRLTREIISAVFPAASSPAGTVTYDATPGYADTDGFDKVGNRRSRTDTFDPEVFPYADQTFTYTERDWLASDEYDLNGNTLLPAGEQFPDEYDKENRLIRRTRELVIGETPFRHIVELVYDTDGNRVCKTNTWLNVTDPENPSLDLDRSYVVYYFVDDRNPTGYAQVIAEEAFGYYLHVDYPRYDKTVHYVYGLDLISQRMGNTADVYFYGYDGHGSVRYLTKGQVTWPQGQPVLNVAVTDTYTYDASELDTPTIAPVVPRKFKRMGQLLGYERSSKRSQAHLRQTEHPNALPASWRCPG